MNRVDCSLYHLAIASAMALHCSCTATTRNRDEVANKTTSQPTTEALPQGRIELGAACEAASECEAGLLCLEQACVEPEQDMAWIEGGRYLMGNAHDIAEQPVHLVSLDGFWMDTHEVTVWEYRQCMSEGFCTQPQPYDGTLLGEWRQRCNEGYPIDRSTHPINCITWYQAQAYCKWKGGELPSEEQWEYAATSRGTSKYPWGNEEPNQTRVNAMGPDSVLDDWLTGSPRVNSAVGWAADGFVDSAPVGSFKLGVSKQGVFDLIGNVREFTTGDWAIGYGREALDGEKVVRGGSGRDWDVRNLTATRRRSWPLDEPYHTTGFRCVKAGPRMVDDRARKAEVK